MSTLDEVKRLVAINNPVRAHKRNARILRYLESDFEVIETKRPRWPGPKIELVKREVFGYFLDCFNWDRTYCYTLYFEKYAEVRDWFNNSHVDCFIAPINYGVTYSLGREFRYAYEVQHTVSEYILGSTRYYNYDEAKAAYERMT